VLDLNAFVKGAIEGFLSSLALMIFFAILPLVSIKSTFQDPRRKNLVWPTVQINPSQKRSLSITLFKPEEFENAGCSALDGKHFENDGF